MTAPNSLGRVRETRGGGGVWEGVSCARSMISNLTTGKFGEHHENIGGSGGGGRVFVAKGGGSGKEKSVEVAK